MSLLKSSVSQTCFGVVCCFFVWGGGGGEGCSEKESLGHVLSMFVSCYFPVCLGAHMSEVT